MKTKFLIKTVFLFSIFFSICGILFAQPSLDWVSHIDQTGNNYFLDKIRIHAIEKDPSGNVFIAGEIMGTVDFNPAAAGGELTSFSSRIDPFVAKYDSDGNYLWAKNIRNSTRNDY